MLHTIAAIPLLLLALFYAPVEVEDGEDVEVFAEGEADGAPGPLVDDAVLTVTVLGTVQDWAATEVTAEATEAAKGEDKPPEAERPATEKKKAEEKKEPDDQGKDGQKPDEAGGDDAAGEDAATAGAGAGTNKPNPKAQSSRKPKKVCTPNPDIARIETWEYAVERDLVERYAKDLKALGKIARVSTHEAPSGAPDGFRLGLPQCSPLRQAGLRTGDIVKDVNGRKIHNVLQAVGAYFTLRNERKFTVHVERKGQLITLRYTVDRGQARKANAEQAAAASSVTPPVTP